MISYDDFSKLELRIGKIVEADNHSNADKLYVLKVDTGEGIIQMVAGIKKSYTTEELVGKHVVVITNLEPRTVRGVESHGMVLAAQSGDTISVLIPDKEVAPGAVVK